MEIHHHQQVDQHHRADDSDRQRRERRFHALHLAADRDRWCPSGSLGLMFVDDLLDGIGHRAQIGILHVGLNVEGRHDVVVRDIGRAVAAIEWSPCCRAVRRCRRGVVIGVFCRALSESILYCGVMTETEYWTPRLGSSQIIRRNLPAGRERNQQVAGDRLLRHADLIGHGAVDIDAKIRRLASPGGYARPPRRECAAICLRKSSAIVKILFLVGLWPQHLHVDRRGQAEVQHLRGDVRRLKPEAQLREIAAATPCAVS